MAAGLQGRQGAGAFQQRRPWGQRQRRCNHATCIGITKRLIAVASKLKVYQPMELYSRAMSRTSPARALSVRMDQFPCVRSRSNPSVKSLSPAGIVFPGTCFGPQLNLARPLPVGHSFCQELSRSPALGQPDELPSGGPLVRGLETQAPLPAFWILQPARAGCLFPAGSG
jgi:hypothetical protein